MLKIEQLSKQFGKKPVLQEISYEFTEGVYGLLGPNGAGKTTLIRCILDLYRYRQGRVILETGTEAEKKEAVIGYVPQKTGVFPGLTVEEHLMYFANIKKMPRTEWEDEITRVLELVHLSEVRRTKGRKLSGGMIRRVGIAQALLNHPVLVILDEPTTGLDPEERMRFKNIIRGLRNDTIVLMSTHIVEDVEAVCDRILILKEGRLAAEGTQEEISYLAEDRVYEVPEALYAAGDYIEKEREVEGETLYRILTARKPEGVSPQKPNVEDGYLCVLKNIG
ncbi:MAG: ATP-binding cassette domain-containing protein [Bacteroides sp.]|nr:ATP-binding cassette domain-containing protein [Bacteroides sp.]MCM1550845.1 ATP-binding cassette domain-containing protein [Clostridium sp.]